MTEKPKSKAFTYIDDYRYNRPLIYGGFIVVISLLLYTFYLNDFNIMPALYMKCDTGIDKSGHCENPLYMSKNMKYCKQDWCKGPFIEPGEYGTPPPSGFLIDNFDALALFIIILVLILNHFLFNRGKTPAVNYPFKDKINKIEFEDDKEE